MIKNKILQSYFTTIEKNGDEISFYQLNNNYDGMCIVIRYNKLALINCYSEAKNILSICIVEYYKKIEISI